MTSSVFVISNPSMQDPGTTMAGFPLLPAAGGGRAAPGPTVAFRLHRLNVSQFLFEIAHLDAPC
ncbi:hypothetical protein O4J55_14845, partial [Paracoccus sp. PXZ]